jgi:hypothetical protein
MLPCDGMARAQQCNGFAKPTTKYSKLLVTTAMTSGQMEDSSVRKTNVGMTLKEGAGSTSDRVMLRKNLHLRRQRAANACTGCHARKVRCDVVLGGSPCTNCRRDSSVCRVKDSNRGSKGKAVEGYVNQRI